jgi:2-dehydropantoate 2-reductase
MGGGGFGSDGVLHGALFRGVIIGTAGATARKRQLDVQAAFRQAGLKVREEQDMRGWLWLHFVSDAGMFAQAVQSGALANMTGDRRALTNAFLTSRDLLPLLEARGVNLRQHRGGMLPYRLPRLVGAMSAVATSILPIAKVSLAMHTDPNAEEPRAVLDDTIREAHRRGIPVTYLEQQVAALDASAAAQR